MTSKLTRERLQELAEGQSGFNLRTATHEESQELARMALAAMDSSESVELPLDYLQGHKDGLEWAARLAEANHPETGDWLYDDPIELAKAIRKGPDMPPAQPVADSEPVAWLLSGGGAKNVVVFDGGNAYADPLREVTPLYRHAQPAPVVPGWIPVSERMPDVGVKVLCFPAKDEPIHATFNGQLWLQDVSWSGSEEPIDNVIPVTVTHWMPLPAGPQGVKGE